DSSWFVAHQSLSVTLDQPAKRPFRFPNERGHLEMAGFPAKIGSVSSQKQPRKHGTPVPGGNDDPIADSLVQASDEHVDSKFDQTVAELQGNGPGKIGGDRARGDERFGFDDYVSFPLAGNQSRVMRGEIGSPGIVVAHEPKRQRPLGTSVHAVPDLKI